MRITSYSTNFHPMLSNEASADLFKLFDDSPVKSNRDNLLVAPYEKKRRETYEIFKRKNNYCDKSVLTIKLTFDLYKYGFVKKLFIKPWFDLTLQSSNPRSILLESRSPSSSNFHRDRGRSLAALRL